MDPITDQTSSRRKGSFHVRRAALVTVALVTVALMTACSAAQSPAPSVSPAPTPGTPAAAPTDEASPTIAAQFPVILIDDEGTEVTIDTEPQRVVSLTPANTEILFTLGQGDKVVGGTDSDDFPHGAADPPDVVTLTEVVIERIVDLEPDLVLAGGTGFTPPADVAQLRGLGIPVIVAYAESVDEVLADIDLVGAAVGASEEAIAISDEMRLRIDEVAAAAAATGDAPRVFYEIDATAEIYGPAEHSFIADMISLAGGDPITSGDPSVYSISLEQLIAEDPEVILLGDAIYGVCPEHVASRPAWSEMTAVREDAIRPVNDIIITRPGPRLGEGVASLAVAIHPGLDLDPAPPEPPSCAP